MLQLKYNTHQAGSALLVSLIIMVLVSVLGLSAIKSSIFTTRVATGIQADAMTFEAAESGLSSTFGVLVGFDEESLFNNIASGFRQCLTGDGFEPDGCGNDDFLDERKLLKVETRSYLDGYQAIEGHQVSVTGSSVLFVDYKVNVLASSEMPSFNIQNDHLQESLKRGLKSGSELE